MTLASLGMLGMSAGRLAVVPIVHAVVTTAIGLALSFALYGLAAGIAAHMFGAGLPGGGRIATISALQSVAICGGVMLLVVLAAAASAWSVQRLDQARILRQGN